MSVLDLVDSLMADLSPANTARFLSPAVAALVYSGFGPWIATTAAAYATAMDARVAAGR